MNILFLGDIVGRPGREVVKKLLPGLIKKHQLDFVFANAENLAGGRGATPETIDEMLSAGVDYFTSGNHIFHQEGFERLLKDESFRILRPLNYPSDIPGQGFKTLKKDDQEIVLVSLIGSTLPGPCQDPFRRAFSLVSDFSLDQSELPVILIDFHAELTSEKRALGFFLDGRVAALLGTHTHVPTADAQILPRGSAYVTDIGMCGATGSVLGVDPSIIIQKMMYPYPVKFEWVKKGATALNSVLIKLAPQKGVSKITRLDFIQR